LTIAVDENIVPPGVSDYLVPLVPGQPFSALVPEPNFAVSIRHTDAGLQAIQHGAKNLRILKVGHRKLENAAEVLIGNKRRGLQAAKC
jgi:hypothetical protein